MVRQDATTAVLRTAVSNTGPLVSAFQCGREDIVRALYDVIFIPGSVLVECEAHGAAAELEALIDVRLISVRSLTHDDEQAAAEMANAIAASPFTSEREPARHLAEAQAMALMNQPGLAARELLLDERAARAVAEERGIPVVGFAGVLIRAARRGLLSPEAVRDALTKCRQQGTRYSHRLIADVYRRLKEGGA